jgi:hypothetical protein
MSAAKKDNTKGVAKPDSAPKTDADSGFCFPAAFESARRKPPELRVLFARGLPGGTYRQGAS